MYSGDEVYDDDVTSGQIEELERIGMDADNASVETIDLTPNWQETAKWFAYMFAEHGFDNRAYQPMATLIEQIAYLAKTDSELIKALVEELNKKGETVEVKIIPSLVLSSVSCYHCGERDVHAEDCEWNTNKVDRHNHSPIEGWAPPACENCTKEIELIDGRWELTAGES